MRIGDTVSVECQWIINLVCILSRCRVWRYINVMAPRDNLQSVRWPAVAYTCSVCKPTASPCMPGRRSYKLQTTPAVTGWPRAVCLAVSRIIIGRRCVFNAFQWSLPAALRCGGGAQPTCHSDCTQLHRPSVRRWNHLPPSFLRGLHVVEFQPVTHSDNLKFSAVKGLCIWRISAKFIWLYVRTKVPLLSLFIWNLCLGNPWTFLRKPNVYRQKYIYRTGPLSLQDYIFAIIMKRQLDCSHT